MIPIIIDSQTKELLSKIFPGVEFKPEPLATESAYSEEAKALFLLCVEYFADPERISNEKSNNLFRDLKSAIVENKVLLVSVPFGYQITAGMAEIEGFKSYNFKIPLNHVGLFYKNPLEFIGEVLFGGIILDGLWNFDKEALQNIAVNILPFYESGYNAKIAFFKYAASNYGVDVDGNLQNAIKSMKAVVAQK
jgi:hypothetical protein